jgi:type IV fimbrial biogenesis protein FimT
MSLFSTASVKGFTLTELMITIALAAILMTIAVPNFLVSLTNNLVNAESNRFLGALILARSEAIKRGVSTTVCRSDNGATCTTAGSNWNNGWIVFVDENGNGNLDAGEQLLRVDNALANNNLRLTVNDNNLQNFIRYLPSGVAKGSGNSTPNGTFLLCRMNRPAYLNDPQVYARNMAINFIGRTAIQRGEFGGTC